MLTSLSKALDRVGKSEMGRKSDTRAALEILGTGQTKALLRHEGKYDSFIDRLKRKVVAGARKKEKSLFKIHAAVSGCEMIRY